MQRLKKAAFLLVFIGWPLNNEQRTFKKSCLDFSFLFLQENKQRMQSRFFINAVKQATLLLLLSITAYVSAQTKTTDIDIQDAVKAATIQNTAVLLARLDEQIAKENYKQTDASFLPRINFSYTAMVTNNPLNAFANKLQQQTIALSDFNPSTLNNPNATTDVMTKLSVQQPIVNLDLFFQRKAAAKQIDLYRYKSQRNTEFITWQVKQVYLQLQLAWTVNEVMQEALNTANATYKLSSDRFEQGLLQKSDLLNVEVEIKNLETRCEESRASIANVSDYLSLLMNTKQGVLYRTKPVNLDQYDEKNISLPRTRADFRSMEAAVESYGYMISGNRTNYLPRMNVFGDYQLHDQHLFGFGANGYLVGVQLSWDIFNGFQTLRKTNAMLLERDRLVLNLKAATEQGQVELSKAIRDLINASYKIKQQVEAVAQSEEALRLLQNRYEQGLATTTDVLSSQTQLSQQKLAYAQAVYYRDCASIYLEFLTITRP